MISPNDGSQHVEAIDVNQEVNMFKRSPHIVLSKNRAQMLAFLLDDKLILLNLTVLANHDLDDSRFKSLLNEHSNFAPVTDQENSMSMYSKLGFMDDQELMR